ncbi:replication-associated recombination protein A [Alkalicella caledoniensis]|uniref:Replication-associated recombination protein A n=1 Tax=Alkalicella caledoniensis TaxID=2731377 RepID=A0A7G9WAQ3_ALKCA|nr:replication-associated recombination protein A [Alkalicella caledoniensis]QNO15765.1 replication-associated recombination protein A [Alkalicella caledoniensis]
MDLFSMANQDKGQPLAAKFRPKTLDDFMGQKHIVGEGSLLRRAIVADKISSMIFYGPPGTGKTTLATIIANTTNCDFKKINAVTAGISDIREVIKDAKNTKDMYLKRTILFIDEIHRFNKSQQDALLPAVEDGTIILIGATTENPYFEVNSALISRSTIFQLQHLKEEDLEELISKVLMDKEKGLGNLNIEITQEAVKHLVFVSGGDARVLLNGLELAVLTTPPNEKGAINISLQEIEQSVQKKGFLYDKNGDNHYDTISAMIKSIRGSDPDAALYWLARLLDSGEDPKFIARRLVISASEDIGNADPNGLNVAVSAFQAVNLIGMPEGRLILAQCATYLASAPKSNSSYVGIAEAQKDVTTKKFPGVPIHLKDAHYKGASKLGHGVEYKYPHSYPGNYTPQQYLPEGLEGQRYYRPTENGYEKNIKEYIKKTKGTWE